MRREGSFLSTSWRGRSWRSRKLASFSNRLSQVLSISTSVGSVTEIWNLRICYSMISTISKLSISVFRILIRLGRHLKRRVGRLATLHLKWLQGSVTTGLSVISGLVVLFCTQWLVGIYLLKTQTPINCIRKYWLVISLFPSLSHHRTKTWFKRFYKPILTKGLR